MSFSQGLIATLLVLQDSTAFTITKTDPTPMPGQELEVILINAATDGRTEVEMDGVPGKKATNAWNPEDEPLPALHKYLVAAAKEDPERIVAMGNPQIMWGGCTDEELLAAYNATVELTGAPMVMGARTQNWIHGGKDSHDPKPARYEDPEVAAGYENLEGRRLRVLTANGLSDAKFQEWTDCSDEDADCSENRSYMFMSNEFGMGPVGVLLKHIECELAEAAAGHHTTSTLECMLRHTDTVTLDYSSKIILDAWQLKPGVFYKEGQAIKNSITGEKSCFIDVQPDDKGNNPLRKRAVKTEFLALFKK